MRGDRRTRRHLGRGSQGLCHLEPRRDGLGGADHRALPFSDGALQGSQVCRIWYVAKDLDRQGPEVRAARARVAGTRETDQLVASPPDHLLLTSASVPSITTPTSWAKTLLSLEPSSGSDSRTRIVFVNVPAGVETRPPPRMAP